MIYPREKENHMARIGPTALHRLALLFTIALVAGFSASCSKKARDSAAPPTASTSASTSATRSPAAESATQLAPQPGPAYALILGPSSIDDGLSQSSATGRAAAGAVSAAADAFGAADPRPAPATSPGVVAAKNLDAAIPPTDYDLAALAKTLPDDPIALYRFVTDRIAVDGYDGVMRGPLVTWMSRAGNPRDKAVLIAWLFVTKNIPYQFVRGSLSATDRMHIATAAAALAPAASVDPRVAAYTSALATDGGKFAAWARGLLSAQNVQLGAANTPADRLSSRHYWIQIARNNAMIDLDPTIPGSAPGTHLGMIDPSFKPTAVLPPEEWHYLQSRSQHRLRTTRRRPSSITAIPYRIRHSPSAS